MSEFIVFNNRTGILSLVEITKAWAQMSSYRSYNWSPSLNYKVLPVGISTSPHILHSVRAGMQLASILRECRLLNVIDCEM